MGNDASGIDKQAASESADQATTALGAYQGDESDLLSNINAKLAGGNPYESKDYLEKQNLETSAAMNSEETAANERLGKTVAETGTNSAALANTEASNSRQASRDLTAYTASRDTANTDKWENEQDQLRREEQGAADSEAGVYSTGTGARSKDLESMTQADDAEQQMWAQLGSAALTGAGTAGAAFCPAEGSTYLMADGTEKPVEALRVGDKIMGIDGAPQMIEEIQTGQASIVLVTTESGEVARNSRTHAFALPIGGFVVAVKSLGRVILTQSGPSRVVSVSPDGTGLVFNVITDGSHTYRASGVWALGVGEAERSVSMDQWETIGGRLSLNV